MKVIIVSLILLLLLSIDLNNCLENVKHNNNGTNNRTNNRTNNYNIVEPKEIKTREKMQDFNDDVVNTSCFKMDDIEINQDYSLNNNIINRVNNNNNGQITSKEIKNLIINNLDWRFLNGKWRCVDSYSDYQESNFNTFGGSIGEFILALHVFQENTYQKIDSDIDLIYELMKKYLKLNNQKYMIYHSSYVVFTKLKRTIFSIYPELEDGFDIDHIQLKYQPQLIRFLTDQEYIGCEFIKQIILGKSLKSISPILVKNIIQSFFQIIWNDKITHSNIYFEIDDPYEPIAILTVNVKPPFICGGPLIYPYLDQRIDNVTRKTFYVIQEEDSIKRGIRESLVKFFYGEFLCDEHHQKKHQKQKNDLISQADYYSNLNQAANIYKEAALKMINGNNYKPKFDLVFNIILGDGLPKRLAVNKQILNNETTTTATPPPIPSNNNTISSESINKTTTATTSQSADKYKNNNSKSFFTGTFIVLGFGLVIAALVYAYFSYKKKKEKYGNHHKLPIFSLNEDDIEDDFDL